MGFLDRLFGADDTATDSAPRRTDTATRPRQPEQRTDDEIAIERYRYLLRTAPPETIEQVHREAFAQLTDEQRAMIYEELSRGAGTGERPLSSEPATLARSATRAEFRQPGSMERIMSGSAFAGQSGAVAPGTAGAAAQQGYGQQRGPGIGAMIGSSLLGTVAGYVIGSALVSAFLPWDGGADQAADGGTDSGDTGADSGADAGADSGTTEAAGADTGGDFGGGDFGGADFGGDFGDFGF
ncbi:hypothetical protein [Schumannella soli]|uniref:DUF2076 domain-containing protein n=1 Tax=Schumannella soli TaxID=2590779 RepID=A0A506XZD5_9MICO|nr:hypothetical protein [Schumannella soli]TPW74617.1 hypothetical protein FJ657_13605 [Schumannella soli]